MTTSNFTVFITFFQECDLTSVTPPPTSISTETEEGLREHETIVEEKEEEEVEQFVCETEEELDEQDVWEEDTVVTVVSVVETASQIQSKGMDKAMLQTHF